MPFENQYVAAYFLARVVLGVLFLFQGMDKLFFVKKNEVLQMVKPEYARFMLPRSFLEFSIIISAVIEFVGGILLIVGLFKVVAFYMLGINLIMVALAFSLAHAMWDMKYYFPRIALLLFLFLLPLDLDHWSLDNLFNIY